MSEEDVSTLNMEYELEIDTTKEWFASLKVACEIMHEARKQKKHVLFYVHGYNNDLNDVVETSLALESLYNVIGNFSRANAL